jgi:hypothetical protein
MAVASGEFFRSEYYYYCLTYFPADITAVMRLLSSTMHGAVSHRWCLCSPAIGRHIARLSASNEQATAYQMYLVARSYLVALVTNAVQVPLVAQTNLWLSGSGSTHPRAWLTACNCKALAHPFVQLHFSPIDEFIVAQIDIQQSVRMLSPTLLSRASSKRPGHLTIHRAFLSLIDPSLAFHF